ncbi:MAG: nicotinate (nicotinamide) nucleotide adenylyltransferase [Planctomycetes bacterium]|nr:nicotinate (nicotinamide) nucleotide adenylyltransferase [Planctomycetota bacterium]
MRLGVLGGSFNPIHHGHLIIARRAAEELRLDRMLLVPTWITPLKSPREIAPGPDRLRMVRLAIRGDDRLDASDIELRRGGVSYTVDTMRALAASGRKLHFVIGSDSLEKIEEWKEIRELARLVTFGIVTRPSYEGLRVPKYIVYRRVAAPLVDISSTEIRERVRRRRSVRYLVPDAVDRYIRRKGLYGGSH